MKSLSNKIVNSLTGKDLKTVLNPLTAIKDEITFSTDKYFRLHSYIIPLKDVDFTDEKAIIARLPKRSNIDELSKHLDKIKKRVHGSKLKSTNDEHTKEMWTDGFERSFATKIETEDRKLFTVRADIANELFLDGNGLIQCALASCTISTPTKIAVDMKKFAMKDTEE